jgi:hypothetical protein
MWFRRYLKLENGIPVARHVWPRVRGDRRRGLWCGVSALGWQRDCAGAGARRGGRHRRQDQSALRQGGRHAAASGERLCCRRGSGTGATGDGGEIEREDGHSGTAGHPGAGRLHRDHRRHGDPAHIAQAIRDRGRDYILAVKDNQPTLADSMRISSEAFQAAPDKTPHTVRRSGEKDHGRLEVRRCVCLRSDRLPASPERWPDLKLRSPSLLPNARSRARPHWNIASTSAACRPMQARLNRRFGQHWRSKTACTGAWMSSLATTRCAPAPVMPPTTSPSCAISPSTSSASIPLKTQGRAQGATPHRRNLRSYRAQLLGLGYKIHAIALVCGRGKTLVSPGFCTMDGLSPHR